MAGRLVIVNPNSARIRDPGERTQLVARTRTVLGRRDGIAPEILETASAAESRPAVHDAIARGAPGVVAMGGDGTLRDVAEAIAGTPLHLGVVPTGTGNQVASSLGIPRSPSRAVDALAGARPHPIDLGVITLHPADGDSTESAFIIGCGSGFDARLMATTPPAWKQRIGQLAYFAQALRMALRLEAVPYRLSVDGEVIETAASLVLVGNMGQLAPGLIQPRLALDPGDGLLDVIAVGATDLIGGLRGLVDQLRRTELGATAAPGRTSLRLRGQRISVRPDRPEPIEVDGDFVTEGRFDASIRAGAVRVLVPAT